MCVTVAQGSQHCHRGMYRCHPSNLVYPHYLRNSRSACSSPFVPAQEAPCEQGHLGIRKLARVLFIHLPLESHIKGSIPFQCWRNQG